MLVNYYLVIFGFGSFIEQNVGFLEVLNNFLLRIQSEEVLKCILVVLILVFLFLIGDLWM